MSLTSCLNEGTEYTYYDDTAITSFQLGTLNRTLHKTKSDGSDNSYVKTLSCSSYNFNIDHARSLIWNNDSLPTGIDVAKVICTVSTKNSGSIGIKHLDSDTLDSYSSTDSIDFTSPRLFCVYNSNGTAYRAYTISINVHQEEGDSCLWTQVATDGKIAKLTNMKALSLEDNMYLFGNEGETPKLYTTTINDGVNWTELATTPILSKDAYKNIIKKSGVFFCISDGKLLKSTDAINWEEVISTDIKQLIASSSHNLYALSADNKIMSSANDGLTWNEEELDTDASYIPTEDISYSCRTLQTDGNAEKVVIIGNRNLDTYPYDLYAHVWTKIEEYGDGSRNHVWSYTTQSWDNNNRPKRAKNWQIIDYDSPNFKGICGEGIGNCKATALSNIYQSGDDGITWLKDSVMRVPSGLYTDEATFTMTKDKDQSVWIICGGTGQVWKARINRLAWKKEEGIFE